MRYALIFSLMLTLILPTSQAAIKVAVASNFIKAAQELVVVYVGLGHDKPILLAGSTGKHTAQILQGFDVDLLLAADSSRPALLEQRDLIIKGSRTNYAVGRLVIWSNALGAKEVWAMAKAIDILTISERIAIANPTLAPYGVAAKELIASLGLDRFLSSRLVIGENIAQAFQFIKTGNVDTGLIARSMTIEKDSSTILLVPESLHSPIEQQMVLLRASEEARQFYDFIKSEAGLAIIMKHGYDAPND